MENIKSMRTFSFVTGGISCTYAVLTVVMIFVGVASAFSLAGADMDYIDANDLGELLALPGMNGMFLLVFLFILAGIIGIVLFILGIIAIVKSNKLPKQVRGRGTALAASIMCTVGIFVAWPLLAFVFLITIYAIIQGVLFIVAGVQLGKVTPEQLVTLDPYTYE